MFIKTLLIIVFSFSIIDIYSQSTTSNLGFEKEQIPVNTIKERSWWNLLHYTIQVTPDYNKKFIAGKNEILFSALRPGKTLQIDLQEPMEIVSVTWNGVSILHTKQKDVYLIEFPKVIAKDEVQSVIIQFKGKPSESTNPPIDNGWIWSKDEKGRPWVSIACEGSGASIWLPCKDVLYDEPDRGCCFTITVPDTLVAVANGKLKNKTTSKSGTVQYTWEVVNPINNYNIVPYIGKYVSWNQKYSGLKGQLDCNFWVIDYNIEKGKKHLKQTDTMLHAFEYWLGPYPFYEDGYKLVEAPMPGMEHQSAIAYGNGFQNGYRGKDFISGSGWGLKWDFMLVHESGHEWFGNSVTCSNDGDSWIHEGFTKYLETLYTDFVFGNKAGNEYALGTWKRIKNDAPVLGTNTTDKYYKGSAMLHMIRQIIGDSAFRGWLQTVQQQYYHQTITTSQVLSALNDYTKNDFSKIFAQYLQTIQIPVLEYFYQKNEFLYRWTNCIEGFDMPIKVMYDGKRYQSISVTTNWQRSTVADIGTTRLLIDSNFLVQTKQWEAESK